MKLLFRAAITGFICMLEPAANRSTVCVLRHRAGMENIGDSVARDVLYTKNMRLGIFFLAIALYAADVSLMEEIICKVNGDIITRGEMIHDKKVLESEMRQQGL